MTFRFELWLSGCQQSFSQNRPKFNIQKYRNFKSIIGNRKTVSTLFLWRGHVRRKIVKGKVENLIFFFAFHFSKRQKFVLGLPK